MNVETQIPTFFHITLLHDDSKGNGRNPYDKVRINIFDRAYNDF